MKKTINDLTTSKTFYKRENDIYGNRTVEPYQKDIKRPVQLVTGLTRFGHYFIDSLIIGAILLGVNVLFVQQGIDVSYPFETNSIGFYYNFIPTIYQIIITVAYYFICEQTMQRTIGKYATGSVVINKYAEAPDKSALFARSFSRLVPFEAFSCLSDRGWHDRWSKTYVVTTKERDTLRKMLNQEKGIFISESDDLLD